MLLRESRDFKVVHFSFQKRKRGQINLVIRDLSDFIEK